MLHIRVGMIVVYIIPDKSLATHDTQTLFNNHFEIAVSHWLWENIKLLKLKNK